MNMLEQMSLKERQALESAITALSEQAEQPLSLNGLLQQWRLFVTEVERAYKASIYEYTNDLSIRDLLQEILLKVPDSLQNKLLELIQPWDTRFYEATLPCERPLLRGVTRERPSPWWFRIPKRRGDELEDDLISEGFIDDE